MSVEIFFTITISILGLLAGIFFAKGSVLMTDKDIEDVSATCLDHNPATVASLQHQRLDYKIGGCLLFCVFLLQLISVCLPVEVVKKVFPWFILVGIDAALVATLTIISINEHKKIGQAK